jgi:protein kinase-like protein
VRSCQDEDVTHPPSSPDADEPGTGEVFASDRGDTFIVNRARLLGRPGASGSVFAGTDAGGGPVAVKEVLVRTDPVRAPAEWSLVNRELEVARRASGRPDLLPIYDHAHLDDRLLIVMPMADRSLDDAIADGMSAEDAIAAFRELAEALQQLAVAGIVHRDIKPANVLWWDGRWCVADFGISRIVEAGTATQTWAGTGTLEYRAPEVWRGEPQTALSDLYALGCLAAEMLTGEVAFPGPDFRGQHERTMPTLPADVEPRLARVVLMLLAKAPEQRPQDARQVIELLARSRELTDAQRVLQRRAAAAERRAREAEVHDERQRRLDELRDRARQTLRLLWDDLAEAARTAVPDATASEYRDAHFLVVADARLAAVHVGAGGGRGAVARGGASRARR